MDDPRLQQKQFHFQNYKEAKENGLISVQRAGNGNGFIVVRRFSPSTGEETEPFMQPIKITALVEKKAELELQLEGISELIKDLSGETESNTKDSE